MRGPKKNHVGKRLGAKWDALGQGAPDLMTDTDFTHPYPSPPKIKRAPVKREAPRQRAVVNGLRRRLPEGSLIWATTNHARTRNQTFFLISQGMVPGMTDLFVLIEGPRLFGIEMKDEGKRASENQLFVHAQLRALGVPVLSECCELEQAVEFLRGQGVEVK